MGLFWEGYVYQFGTRGACAPRSTPAGLARARADARAACSNHFVFQSSDQGEAGGCIGMEVSGGANGDDPTGWARGGAISQVHAGGACAPAGGARASRRREGHAGGARVTPRVTPARPLMMMMMMMTFIT